MILLVFIVPCYASVKEKTEIKNMKTKSIFELCFSSIRFNCIYVYPVQEITQENTPNCEFENPQR